MKEDIFAPVVDDTPIPSEIEAVVVVKILLAVGLGATDVIEDGINS